MFTYTEKSVLLPAVLRKKRSMSLEIRKINTRREIHQFIDFANDLYADCQYYCPPLYFDELNTFDEKKNPALEVCEKQLFMAYRDGKEVGRIAAIINHRANAHWGYKKVRFGWMDFVDNEEVSRALLDAVRDWGKERGMTAMNGPVGFTDWDHQGLLIEGYDYLAPLASLYNYAYYEKHLEDYGLTKEADWIEYRITPPQVMPEKLGRISEIVKERYHVRVDKVHSAKELQRKYGSTYMDVLDEAYQHLYNFQPMTQRQKDYYKNMYFPILNFDFVTIVVNEKDEIVGAGVGMPDISEAVRKCGGKLLPFGWYHILKALRAKKMDVFDLLLIGVRPDYQNKGINSVIMADWVPYYIKYGIKQTETTAMLETNNKVLSQMDLFETKQHKRRRAYVKEI